MNPETPRWGDEVKLSAPTSGTDDGKDGCASGADDGAVPGFQITVNGHAGWVTSNTALRNNVRNAFFEIKEKSRRSANNV